MTRRAVFLEGAKHTLPFSPALVWRDMVFVSGQVGKDPATGEFQPGIAAQARQTLENVRAVLQAAGSSMSDVLQVTIYMTDMQGEFAELNTVYREFFPEGVRPARSTVGISHLALPGLKVEIDVVAAVSSAAS
ncbi:RidA family protein [Ramlibacter sp.]|uniref:RidA family protein n=1 Tax=Ramlibacter sp. TaxID=1917967 RepID=UPI003D0F9118